MCLCLIANPYTNGFFLFNYFYVNDILQILLLLIGLWLIDEDRFVWFSLVGLVGAFFREIVPFLFLAGIARSVFERNVHWKKGWRWLLVGLPGLVVWIWIRALVQPSDPDFTLVFSLLDSLSKHLSPENWIRLLLHPFLPITFILLVYYRRCTEVFAKNMHFVVLVLLVVVSTAFGGDTERLMAPAFIVVYFLVANALTAVNKKHLPIALSTIVLGSLAVSPHFLFAGGAWQSSKESYYAWCQAIQFAVGITFVVLKRQSLPDSDN